MPPGTRLRRAAATPVAPQLTHVTVGDFCRAQAVRDALSAAGGAVPCQDKDRQRVGTARGQGVRNRGQRVALTKGAVAVAVVGAMVQEGVRDAAGVTCRTGGSLSPLVAPLSPGCMALGHKAAPSTLPWHGASSEPRTELAPTQERCWESPESHGKKETDLVRCKGPAQPCQPHSREVWDLPVPSP